ncbi:alpha-amylase family glycosyl hydrolase [Nocardioides zeae]
MHGLSRTFDPGAFTWTDAGWTGRQLPGSVVYELHVGTFTPEGTLDAAVGRLDHLLSIGVDLVELLPVNAFNGTHNWGYDGVGWFAVTEAYGGPAAYQRFVDACHAAGLGVVQDVVYNHLGPSGNYLPLYGPYLASGRNTWGDYVNLDGEESDEVRRYVLDNVRSWFHDFHVDGLRLDAVHALRDSSDRHVLEEMAVETAAYSAQVGRPLTLIAESDLNDPVMFTPREAGATASPRSGATTSTTRCTSRSRARRAATTRTSSRSRRCRRCSPTGSSTTAPTARSASATTACPSTSAPRRPGGSSCARRTTTRSATAPAVTGSPSTSTTTSSPPRPC